MDCEAENSAEVLPEETDQQVKGEEHLLETSTDEDSKSEDFCLCKMCRELETPESYQGSHDSTTESLSSFKNITSALHGKCMDCSSFDSITDFAYVPSCNGPPVDGNECPLDSCLDSHNRGAEVKGNDPMMPVEVLAVESRIARESLKVSPYSGMQEFTSNDLVTVEDILRMLFIKLSLILSEQDFAFQEDDSATCDWSFSSSNLRVQDFWCKSCDTEELTSVGESSSECEEKSISSTECVSFVRYGMCAKVLPGDSGKEFEFIPVLRKHSGSCGDKDSVLSFFGNASEECATEEVKTIDIKDSEKQNHFESVQKILLESKEHEEMKRKQGTVHLCEEANAASPSLAIWDSSGKRHAASQASYQECMGDQETKIIPSSSKQITQKNSSSFRHCELDDPNVTYSSSLQSLDSNDSDSSCMSDVIKAKEALYTKKSFWRKIRSHLRSFGKLFFK